MFTAFRTLTLITTPLLPLLLKTLSERSAFRLSLRGTPVFPLLLKRVSPNLETEAEAILTLLIKLIGGKTGWLTPVSLGLPGWMRVLVMEIMRR
jgi:Guanine nucleotide exchange factor in Golgi transport N-terminal